MSGPRSRILLGLLSLSLALLLGCEDRDLTAPLPDVEQEESDGAPVDDQDSPLGIATGRTLQLAAEDPGVEMDDLEVVTAEEVTWPDGALGCPEPGQTYTQALVEGYRIVLEIDGERVSYHADDPQSPFRCDDPEVPVES